jgi:RNA polymerase sigma factor (sigma-70 family)
MRDNLSACDDDDLLRRARSDPGAFGELVRRHQSAGLRVAAAVCGSTEHAPDVVQDAFVAAYRHAGAYRGESSVRSWLLRIVANHAKNELRTRGRRLRRDDRHARLTLTEAASDAGPDEIAARHGDRRRLADALVRLPVADREVLGCRFLAGLSEAETAEVLSVAVGTVKSRTSRGLARLRAEMATSEGTADD